MDTKKLKKDYASLQIKLYDYVNILDDMLTKYLNDPNTISYKEISHLSELINEMLVHNSNLQNMIICSELIA